jgi:hypothetical protein
MRNICKLVTVAALLGSVANAQTASPTPLAEKPSASVAETIDALARSMEESFVFPEIGARYAAGLKARLASGAYAAMSEPAALAQQLTADLQAINADRHVRVLSPSDPMLGVRQGQQGGGTGLQLVGLTKQGWIAPWVAYASFSAFPGDAASVAEVRRFLEDHADARSVIFDFRQHRGGTLAEMDPIFEQIFAVETELVHMETRAAVERRQGSPISEGRTMRRLASPDSVVRRSHWAVPATRGGDLADAQIFILTSSRTASAAEHFALALKRTGRAILIGETTAGAGHYGGLVPLPGGYRVFVPVGRTYDPETSQGWEATGIAPNIAVPADEALDVALRQIGVDPASNWL